MVISMKNPFRFERPHSAKGLVGREEELDQLVRAATRGAKLFVLGKRGVGKTVLLEAAVSRIEREKGAFPILIGLRDLVSVEAMAEKILIAVAQTARGEKEALSLLNTYFGFHHPEAVAMDAEGRVRRVRHVFFTGLGENEFTNLNGILRALNHFAVRMNLKIALFVDDADELQSHFSTAEIETLFAETLGPTSSVAAILAYASEKFRDGNVFPKLDWATDLIELQPPFWEEWFRYFANGFRKIGCEIEKEARFEFERLSYAGPYFLLTVASHLWEKVATGQTQEKAITKGSILKTVEEISDSFEPCFAARWRGLTLNQRRAISAVIHEDDSTLLSPDVLSRYRLSGATMERELLRCASLGILDHYDLGESNSWSLPDVFFRRWLEKNQVSPLQRR